MYAISSSIIGYQVSDDRTVGPCTLAMLMALGKIADGYSAYPLASQLFAFIEDNPLNFDITQVIGLTNKTEKCLHSFVPLNKC